MNPAEQCCRLAGVTAGFNVVFHSDLHPIAHGRQPYLSTLRRGLFRLVTAEQATEETRLVFRCALLGVDVIHTGGAVQIVDLDIRAGQGLTYCCPGTIEVRIDVEYRVAGTVLNQ